MTDWVEGLTRCFARGFADVGVTYEAFLAGYLVTVFVELGQRSWSAFAFRALGLARVFAVFVFLAEVFGIASTINAFGFGGIFAVFVFFARFGWLVFALFVFADLAFRAMLILATTALVFLRAVGGFVTTLCVFVADVAVATVFIFAANNGCALPVLAGLLNGTVSGFFAAVAIVVVVAISAAAREVEPPSQKE